MTYLLFKPQLNGQLLRGGLPDLIKLSHRGAWQAAVQLSAVQSLSHVQLCDLMNCSTPGLPVHHQLLESSQTHVHCFGDAIHLKSIPFVAGNLPLCGSEDCCCVLLTLPHTERVSLPDLASDG